MADTLVIDAEHPWPWLEAFPESAERFFNGRDDEKVALFRCLTSAPVTVLFGKSGLGKSSLLHAGLFPSLRAERLLPVYVRLLHESNSPSLSVQIAKRLADEIHKTQSNSAPSARLTYRHRRTDREPSDEPISISENLWAELHRNDIELVDETGKRWQPVFVLDQFEEIFTLDAQNPNRQSQLFYELGDLMENRIPKALAERLNSDDELFDQLNLDTQHYRFLLSLREDYLPDLEEWSELIPRLGPNRFRLLPMSASNAIAAVQKTGGSLVTAEDAENIVRYLLQTHSMHDSIRHKRRGAVQIEPALLGLMCAGLNDERIRNKQSRLKTSNLSQEGGQIVEHFYDMALAGLPESVHEFVEQHLITADGVRLAYPARSIETEKQVNAQQLNTLVDKRLLRRESLESGDRIELVHDRLAQITLHRRNQRQQRQQLRKQQQQRRYWLLGAGSLMLLLAVFAAYMWDAENKAHHAWMDATATRLAIEGSSIAAGMRQDVMVTGLFKVLTSHRLAQLANSSDALLDDVLQTEYLQFQNLAFIQQTHAAITCVAYSPDGSRIVSGSRDNTMQLWDAKTGQPIGKPLSGHQDRIVSVAFSPNGERIVSGSWDKSLRQWDVKTGQAIGQPLTGHQDFVSSVAFSPDGKRIVSGGMDKTVRLWDANSSQPVESFVINYQDRISSVAFSPDGNRIVTGSLDKLLQQWDANSGQAIGQAFKGHLDRVSSVAYSPDGSRIVSGSWDNTLRLWNAKTGQPIGKPLTGHQDSVWSVAFSPDGNLIVSGSFDKTLRLWDAKTGQPVGQPLTGHQDRISSIVFSPDGNYIVSGSWDNTLRLWDAKTGQPLTGHQNGVSKVAFSPDGKRLVSGSWDNTLRLWDAKTGQAIGQPLTGHQDGVSSAAFSPDGNRIVSGSWDNTLRLWDANTGQPIGQPFNGHQDRVSSVAFSPDGKRIVSGSEDKTLRLWDANSGEPIGQPLSGHQDGVSAVAFSPDGKRIVSSSYDMTLRLWDAVTGSAVAQPLVGHQDGVSSVAFSPDGNRIVSGSFDKTLRLWDANTGQPIGQPLSGYQDSVWSVAFSPDGRYIVSGSKDKTLRLWDVKTGQAIGRPLSGHQKSVSSVAFSPDGNHIVSASFDSTLRIWDVFEAWADALCKKLTRNMSHQEWRDWVSPDIDYIEQCPGLPIPDDETQPLPGAISIKTY